MMMSRTLALVFSLSFLPTPALAAPEVFVSVPGVRVTVAPPPLRVEAQPVRPSVRHLWIAGHWAWRGGAHVWMPGYWALPPGAGYAWVPARWVQEGGQWVFYQGHWRRAVEPPPNVVYEPSPPRGAVVLRAPPP